MKINLYDYVINLSNDYVFSSELFYFVHNKAIKCSEKLLDAYISYNSLNELITYAQKKKDKIYFQTIEEIVDGINTDLGIYSVNIDSFKKECQKYWGQFEIAFAEIYEKYLELCGEKELAKKYREYRKDSRSRLVGGGFGVSGAAKGILMAGTVNMTTGIFHSVFNLIDGAFENANINSQMKKVFNDPNNKFALSQAVYDDILTIIYPLVDILQENSEFRFQYDFENYEKATVIFDNITNNRIPKEHLKKNVVEMIYLSPYEPDNYAIAYHLFGDENDELEKLANELCVDIDLTGYKNAQKNAQTFFGMDYKKVESQMKGNIFFRKTKDLLGSDYSTLLYECKLLLSKRLSNIIISIKETDKIKRFNTAISLFGNFDTEEESPLLLFDKSLTCSGKDGFIITNRNLYFNGGSILPIIEINNIDFNPFNIIINNYKISIGWANLYESDLLEITDLLEYFVLVYKYSNKLLEYKNTSNCSSNTTIDKESLMISLKNDKDATEYSRAIINTFCDKELENKLYPTSDNPKTIKKFQNCINTYASLTNNEIPLICFDNTAFGSAKDGCLITSKSIYIHNSFSKAKNFKFNEIISIEVKGGFAKELFINNYEVSTTVLSSSESKNIFCKLLNHILIEFMVNNHHYKLIKYLLVLIFTSSILLYCSSNKFTPYNSTFAKDKKLTTYIKLNYQKVMLTSNTAMNVYIDNKKIFKQTAGSKKTYKMKLNKGIHHFYLKNDGIYKTDVLIFKVTKAKQTFSFGAKTRLTFGVKVWSNNN